VSTFPPSGQETKLDKVHSNREGNSWAADNTLGNTQEEALSRSEGGQ
jgi:hypothetical protein